MPRLSVNLLSWNGARYLPHHLASLRDQTLRDWELVALDNGSTDQTVTVLERVWGDCAIPARFERNRENVGFARGHNQLLRMTSTPFVLLCNQDTVLAPDYLARLLAALEADERTGAVQGALLRWDFSRADESDGGRTDTIDTLGLRVLRNRRVVDWMAGASLASVACALSSPHEVFGVSGALPMHRRAALEDVTIADEVLDEDFFSYKEDVDLAFRLRSSGWRAYLVPEARAWHDRTAAGPRSLSDEATLDHRRAKSAPVNAHSYRNHLWVLVKNEHPRNFARDWPWMVWYECKKLAYLLVRERETLRRLREVWRFRHRMRAKRRAVMARWIVPPAEVRRWFI